MGKSNLPFARSYWVVPGRLLAGLYPGDKHAAVARSKLRGLVECGIRQVVNLMEADETNWQGQPFTPYEPLLTELARAAGADTRCVRMPIKDRAVPTRAQMRAILDIIDEAIAVGRPVYVHCWGGKGRTGTVVGCYLARHGKATGRGALAMIDELRAFDPQAHAPPPENAAQCEMVVSWRVGE